MSESPSKKAKNEESSSLGVMLMKKAEALCLSGADPSVVVMYDKVAHRPVQILRRGRIPSNAALTSLFMNETLSCFATPQIPVKRRRRSSVFPTVSKDDPYGLKKMPGEEVCFGFCF
jgi:hypothetical protein